jgi:hypothetical protein
MPERKKIKMRTGYEVCRVQARTREGNEGDIFWKERNTWKGLNAGQQHKCGNVQGGRGGGTRFIRML